MESTEQPQTWEPILERDGCQLIRSALSPQQIEQAKVHCEELLQSSGPGILSSRGVAYGARNLLELWPTVVTLLKSNEVQQFVSAVIGPDAMLVRGLLFDKPPSRSWTLPWHRDRTIAVEDFDVNQLPDGFSSPTRKARTMHLNAPVSLLKQMITLRISLDPMTSENGQLAVLPGSHIVSDCDADIEAIAECNNKASRAGGPRPVYCDAGDIFAMRPLLAHSSIKSAEHTQLRRRVVHLEICDPRLLPQPLNWKHSLAFLSDLL